MSVDTNDATVQWEIMLHSDMRTVPIGHVLRTIAPVSRQRYVDRWVKSPEKRCTSLSNFRQCADCQFWSEVLEKNG